MSFFNETKTKKLGIVLIFIMAFIVVLNKPFFVDAQTEAEINQKKSALQAKIEQINKQIQAYQGQINNTRKQQASLKNEISIYDNQISSTELQIQANETQIEDTDLQINELQTQIEKRVKEINDNKKILSELVVQLHQLDGNSLLNISLGNDDFSSFLDQVQYTESVQNKVYNIVQNIKTIKSKLEAQQRELKGELQKLQDLQEQIKITQSALQGQRSQKQGLLDKTKGLEKNYQKLLTGSQAEEANLQKEINDLDDSIRAKLGNRSLSASGALAYPMKGVKTQGYGKTGFTALGYTFHNGIDIAAPAGTPIYAAANGTIGSCDTGEAAYGNWCTQKVTIKTKKGDQQLVLLYAHMRSIKARSGQQLKQGDLIGYEGNTGNTSRLLYGPDRGYHLHFTVFDAEGFGISQGKYTKVYGSYSVPYGYTYNPLDFL